MVKLVAAASSLAVMCVLAGLCVYAVRAAKLAPPPSTPQLALAMQTARSAAAGPRLRVLTLNTFLRPVPVNHHGIHGDAKWERLIPLVAQLLLPHDVLALQEVWAFRRQLLSMLRAAGFAHIVLPQPAAHGALIDSGLVIASRFPITEARRVLFRGGASGCKPAGADRHASKGVLYAAVAAPNGQRYHVFNTHLQATYTREPSAAEAAALRCQLAALVRFVDAHAPGGEAAIVAGDFNMPPHWARPAMRAAGFRDVLREDDATPTIHIVYDADGRELSTVTRMCAKCAARYAGHPLVAVRLDHLWVRRLGVHSARVLPTHGASDHDGLRAEVH